MWNKRLVKALEKQEAYKDDMGRIHITPSSLGTCLRSVQLREKHMPQGPPNYYMVRGGLVHDVVEEMIKSANPLNTKDIWQKIRKRQRTLPSEWQLPLNQIMPEYEATFRDFLKNDHFASRLLKANVMWIEQKMRVPLENLNLGLPFTDEVLKRYAVVGIPDLYFGNSILEFKTGSVYDHYYSQGLMYEKMAQIHFKNPKIRNLIIQIKPKKVTIGMKVNARWLRRREEKEEKLKQNVTALVQEHEKWAQDKNYKMPKAKTGYCYGCLYYKSCFPSIERRYLSMKYKVVSSIKNLRKKIQRRDQKKK